MKTPKLSRRDFIKFGIGTSLLLPYAPSLFARDAGREITPLLLDASSNNNKIVANFLKMGTSRNPRGEVLTADTRSLLLNSKRWLPVMGEFHYSRYPENEWRDELLKMKMGGIDIVATYVFWIHHEEIEGQFDWTGQRNLRKFFELCNELGLYSIVRCGPWCHGEVRNGGFPDWLMNKPFKTRTDAPEYLEKVKILYSEIGKQIKGLLWKDGGSIVGAQFENEFKGRAEHLLNLKKIALEAGIDVPLYTRTAWHSMASPLPLGEVIPLFGAYAEGFWDREITPMPGKYGDGFLFRTARIDSSIATDQLGAGVRKDTEDVNAYPYFCCEIGGGMMISYHRRILNNPKDIESIALVKIGSGNNLQGFYMYHGGTNPIGKLSTLQESQATNYWNDLPVKTYDFQAPLGEFGQVNEHYHLLRRQHLLLKDFGMHLAEMTAFMPEKQPQTSKDAENLRWSARTDGEGGFIFVNNYQRLQKMPPKANVQFQVKLKNGTLTFPSKSLTVAENAIFFLPFNLKIEDTNIVYATAQPLCKIEDKSGTYIFFSAISGIPSEFVFDKNTKIEKTKGTISNSNNQVSVSGLQSGTSEAMLLETASGKIIKIILLSEKQSLGLWKSEFQNRERVFLTDAGLITDKDSLRLYSENTAAHKIAIFPAPDASLSANSLKFKSNPNGIFAEFVALPKNISYKLEMKQIAEAKAPREIKMGSKGVAEAPNDADFEGAAVWQIKLPKDINHNQNLILRIAYQGDAARFYLGDQLLTDNFYNGRVFEVGLKRYAPEVYQKDLNLKILPLRKDAPIYLDDSAKPAFEGKDSICKLLTANLVEIYETDFKTR